MPGTQRAASSRRASTSCPSTSALLSLHPGARSYASDESGQRRRTTAARIPGALERAAQSLGGLAFLHRERPNKPVSKTHLKAASASPGRRPAIRCLTKRRPPLHPKLGAAPPTRPPPAFLHLTDRHALDLRHDVAALQGLPLAGLQERTERGLVVRAPGSGDEDASGDSHGRRVYEGSDALPSPS